MDKDSDLYLLIAEEFCNSQEKRKEIILEACTEKDFQKLEREIHTLKGLFYTFGSMFFGEETKKIEVMLHNPSFDFPYLQKFIDEILIFDSILVAEIRNDINSPKP